MPHQTNVPCEAESNQPKLISDRRHRRLQEKEQAKQIRDHFAREENKTKEEEMRRTYDSFSQRWRQNQPPNTNYATNNVNNQTSSQDMQRILDGQVNLESRLGNVERFLGDVQNSQRVTGEEVKRLKEGATTNKKELDDFKTSQQRAWNDQERKNRQLESFKQKMHDQLNGVKNRVTAVEKSVRKDPEVHYSRRYHG
jgi:flagellar motor switch/type III secretory pathway protein FliN